MSVKEIFKNVVAWAFHGVDRTLYEYYSYKYLENKDDMLPPLSKDEKISKEQMGMAANHVMERMISRSEKYPFLRAPLRKNSIVPKIE